MSDVISPGTSVSELFEAQARKTPQSIAVECEGETLTYAALESRAHQLALELRERGVGAEDRVGLLMQRTPELVVSILGVLKAGAAYVPLEPSHPAERLA